MIVPSFFWTSIPNAALIIRKPLSSSAVSSSTKKALMHTSKSFLLFRYRNHPLPSICDWHSQISAYSPLSRGFLHRYATIHSLAPVEVLRPLQQDSGSGGDRQNPNLALPWPISLDYPLSRTKPSPQSIRPLIAGAVGDQRNVVACSVIWIRLDFRIRVFCSL